MSPFSTAYPLRRRSSDAFLIMVMVVLTWTEGRLLAQVGNDSGRRRQPELVQLPGDREQNRWRIPVSDGSKIRVPRVYASLRNSYFEGFPNKRVTVRPGIDEWELTFTGQPAARHIVLEFDSFPATLSEIGPTKQKGDGTFALPCSLTQTTGKKLRFEPQPHKNTIGYWVEPTDYAEWNIEVKQPAEFNVGLLQGAGNNGGGTAKISILTSSGTTVDSFVYTVQTTGHFQNFIWTNAGTLKVMEEGTYKLRIQPQKIDGVALMDVRQVHLSPKR